jgi:hypothetical protein
MFSHPEEKRDANGRQDRRERRPGRQRVAAVGLVQVLDALTRPAVHMSGHIQVRQLRFGPGYADVRRRDDPAADIRTPTCVAKA